MEQCINCGEDLHGAYCSRCGQKTRKDRFTLANILEDFLANLTNVERGLWYTVKMLFIAPHQVLRDYLDGKTRPYFSPGRYLILIGGLNALIVLGFGFFDLQADRMNEMLNTPQDPEMLAMQQKINDVMKGMVQFILFLMLPFMAIVSRRVFRRHRLNFAEHLIIHTFLLAQLALVGIPMQVLFLFQPGLILWAIPLSLLVGVLYYTFALKSFFQLSSYPAAFARSLLVYLGGYLLFFLASGILGMIAGIYIGYQKAKNGGG